MSDGPTSTPSRAGARPRQGGDAARRMLLTTVAITTVVAIGVFAWSLVRGDDDDTVAASSDWSRIAIIDHTTGAVTTFGPDGERLDRTTGTGRLQDAMAHGDRLALIGQSEIRLVAGDETLTAVPIPAGSDVVPIETGGGWRLAVTITDAAGGLTNLLIVDTVDGSVIDLAAAAAPTELRLFLETLEVSPDGTRFAVADANNFQTIVVGDDIDGAAFLADQPLAVGDELVATSQVVNRQADISLVDLERQPVAVVPADLPAGGMMVADELLMVSIDGGIFRIGGDDRQPEELGRIPVPTDGVVRWAEPSYRGERLVVGGSNFVSVLDLDGTAVGEIIPIEPAVVSHPHRDWRCFPVGVGGAAQSMVDLGTGQVVADLSGVVVMDVSSDGCAVVAERNGALELIDTDGGVRLGVLREAVVAPDAAGVVWTTTSGRLQYVPVTGDHELGDPVDLATAPTNVSVAFLPGD